MRLSWTAAVAALIPLLASATPSSDVIAPLEKRAGPTVRGTTPQATYVGSSAQGIDNFKGIPFAQSVANKNRLTAPRPITSSLGTVQAAEYGPGCPSQSLAGPPTSNLPAAVANALQQSPLFQLAMDTDEDCLTINIQRPAGTRANAKLPVVFYIYGGGFEAGSASMYDGTNLIKSSQDQNEPVIFVTSGYRLSAYGWLAGKEVKDAGVSNLGLLDQRRALEWTADNIAAFGGDPSKVTIWGESAGAISVFDQMALYDGNHNYKGKPLFRGAIMNSGSIVPANPVDGFKGQAQYDTVVDAAGCKGKADTLQCLRNVDATTFMDASSANPGIFSYSSLALAYLPRPDGTVLTQSPDLLVQQGKYAKVPFIIGDLEDEGTLFSLVTFNTSTTKQIVDYLHNIYFPDVPRSRVQGLVDVYPEDPAAGSPFRTGKLNQLYPGYKRIAAILGDITFTLTRRAFLSLVEANEPTLPTWSYLATYFHLFPVLGSFHGSDILRFTGDLPGKPATAFMGYYVSFFNHLDPNTSKPASLVQWPRWTAGKRLVNIREFFPQMKIIPDNFRPKQYNYLAANTNGLRI